MHLESETVPASDRYVQAMRPCLTGDGFDRALATRALLTLVGDLEAARTPPASIVQLAVDLLPILPESRDTVWAISLRDWTRTAVRETLRASVFDRRAAARDVG